MEILKIEATIIIDRKDDGSVNYDNLSRNMEHVGDNISISGREMRGEVMSQPPTEGIENNPEMKKYVDQFIEDGVFKFSIVSRPWLSKIGAEIHAEENKKKFPDDYKEGKLGGQSFFKPKN